MFASMINQDTFHERHIAGHTCLAKYYSLVYALYSNFKRPPLPSQCKPSFKKVQVFEDV